MVDFPLNLSDRKEYYAWLDGSLWLSLDRFERFWPDAGLAFSNGEAVKSSMREALRTTYAIDAKGRESEEDDLNYIDYIKELAETCFRTLDKTAGTGDAERVAAWMAGPVLARIKEPAWHREWAAVLYHLWKEDPDTVASRHGISSDTARRIGEISALYRAEIEATRSRVEEAEQEPLSGWDAIAYADYQREGPGVSPLTPVLLYLHYVVFDRAWSEVRRCTPPEEIDGLIRWGQAYNREHLSDFPEEEVILPEDVRRAW
jgi:hypothetical protein